MIGSEFAVATGRADTTGVDVGDIAVCGSALREELFDISVFAGCIPGSDEADATIVLPPASCRQLITVSVTPIARETSPKTGSSVDLKYDGNRVKSFSNNNPGTLRTRRNRRGSTTALHCGKLSSSKTDQG